MEKQWKEWASHPVEFEFIRKNADIGRKLCIMFIGTSETLYSQYSTKKKIFFNYTTSL